MNREDYYDECKYYCQNVELLELIDDMIFDCRYNDNEESSILKLKAFILSHIEYTEKKRLGHTLKE